MRSGASAARHTRWCMCVDLLLCPPRAGRVPLVLAQSLGESKAQVEAVGAGKAKRSIIGGFILIGSTKFFTHHVISNSGEREMIGVDGLSFAVAFVLDHHGGALPFLHPCLG